MAKTKKNIKDFQQALLSNTKFIKKESAKEEEPEAIAPDTSHPLHIDPEILSDIKLLAEHENKEFINLIHVALKHYLGLKSLRLEEAKKAKE